VRGFVKRYGDKLLASPANHRPTIPDEWIGPEIGHLIKNDGSNRAYFDTVKIAQIDVSI
jgi:hypothetical protein